MATYTTIVNTCGGRKYFSFLPPHGIELDDCQSHTIIGDLETRLIPSWPFHSNKDRPPHPMKLSALKAAKERGELKVLISLAATVIKTTKSVGTNCKCPFR